MPAPASIDLRRRVVEAYQEGNATLAEVAARFKVGVASVNRWASLLRRTGSIEPKHGTPGFAPHIPDDRLDEFRTIIRQHPDALLPELADLCAAHFGVSCSPAAVSRACKRANISRKKRR